MSISESEQNEVPFLYGRATTLSDEERLRVLRSTGLVGSPALNSLDKMTNLAQDLIGAPIVGISLVESDRQYFLSEAGLPEPVKTTRVVTIDSSICHKLIGTGKPLIISDTQKDPSFVDHPAAKEHGVRSYLGYPITAQGEILGVFCALDFQPREWSRLERRIVSSFAEMVSFQIELRLELSRGHHLKVALEQSNRELKEFAQIATHDLKEPLRGVRGCLEATLGIMPDLPPAVSELLQMAASSAARMTELVSSLYTYSRLDEQILEMDDLEAEELLKEVLCDIDQLIREKGASVEYRGLGEVRGNRVLLRQLFQNLIANAVKFAQEGVSPVVTVSRQGDVFTVADNGIGIKEEEAKIIFEPFQRGTGSSLPGTGIGLAICRRVVDKHFGKIWVESTRGSGSRFHFILGPLPN